MKKLVLIVCVSGLCLSLNAQYETSIKPFRDKNGKYGIAKILAKYDYNYELIGREVIVKPKYDTINDFWENYAIVKLKNKWGFINKEGKEITPIKYDLCREFTNGYATVKLNDKWGYVDTNGKEKILLGDYDDIGNTWGIDILYEWGDGITTHQFSNVFLGNFIVIKINEKFGLIDTNENVVVPCKYDEIEKTRIYGDLISVRIGDKQGIINNEGTEIIPIIYDEIDMDYKKDSVFIVQIGNKQGIIDFNGKEVISLKWDKCIPSCNERTIVKLNEKYGLIENYTEKEIIPMKYDGIGYVQNLLRVKLNEKYGVIDITEKEIIPMQYDWLHFASFDRYDLSRIFIVIRLDDKCGITDENGKEILPIKYDAIRYSSIGFASVQMNGKWGIIDETGNEIIPIKYDEEIYFYKNKDYAIVEINGKRGIIDTTGKEIIPIQYEMLFYDSYPQTIIVSCDTMLYFLDKTSKKIITSMIYADNYVWLSDDYIAVKKVSGWGIVNTSGKKIIPFKYSFSEVQKKLRKMEGKNKK